MFANLANKPLPARNFGTYCLTTQINMD